MVSVLTLWGSIPCYSIYSIMPKTHIQFQTVHAGKVCEHEKKV